MRYVLAVAEAGNFSLAAQSCHVGQPALSQQVAKLERELGVPLFHRGPKGAVLTQAGEEFVHHARALLQQAQALEAKMALYSGVRRGTLNLGSITSLECIDFGGMLSAFCRSYPEISVNIVQQGTRALLTLLQERQLDLAFLNFPPEGLPPNLHFLKLGEDTYSLAVPWLHPLAGRDMVSLGELREERYIFHQGGQVAAELCLAACREAGFQPNVVCRSGSPTAGLYLVRGGLGVAFLPSEEFRTHAVDGVVELRLKERIVKEVGAAWRRDVTSPVVEAAFTFARDWRH